jgi:DNA-binding NtrC family response regulator
MNAAASEKLTALLVEDDKDALEALAALVSMEGFRTVMVPNLEAARKQIAKDPPDLVLLDVVLPDGQGFDLLEEIAEEGKAEVIMITGQASVETAVQALRLGAYDYLTKPVDVARLKTLLARLQSTRELKKEVVSLRSELRELGRFGPMVGMSQAMQRVYDLLEKVAPTDATVFLVGESGTGKEIAAQAVHSLSRRRDANFLALNCGAISETLIESELFGHERGAFTGANKRHEGHFERCSGGTIFLDEITEMPMEAQVKLLRVLESGQVLRVGGNKEIEVDVRVLAATNRDPQEAVEEGRLRKDLLYRLKVFPLELPPLRDREGDVETLSQHFLGGLTKRHGESKVLSPEALERLKAWHWPGNVRELRNVLERAYILADSVILPDDLPGEITGAEEARGPSVHVRVGASLEEVEKRVILATLDQLEGDKKSAADMLGISLKTLYNRLKVYEGRD